MRLSHSLVPTLKETPADAQIASHRLMLRAGLVRQTASGIYTWLPAGWRVLRRISQIVREEQDRIGAQEILMPTLQSADLWKQSGRYEAYGPEMLRLRDRHDRELIYSPTNELLIADIMRQSVRSYRELPQTIYHIQWKFRDETRPRFGVMRGREFLMKDAYSFDMDHQAAVRSYRLMALAYMRTFRLLGVQAVPMAADTGPIGGDLSHEFHILAPTGESQVFYDSAVEQVDANADIDSSDPAQVDTFFESLTRPYAATDEKHDPSAWERVPVERRREGRGIEVGQIFNFGTLYSELVGLEVAGPDGKPVPPNMGSYGIGVSRLVGALIEAPPRRGRHQVARRRGSLPRRPAQPQAERHCLRCPVRTHLRRPPGPALRRPPGARRCQVRGRRPHGPPLAARRRPPRRRRRHGGAQAPHHRRARRALPRQRPRPLVIRRLS